MTRRVALELTRGLFRLFVRCCFLTNLTRNPYYTQIVLLNLGILAVGIVWSVEALQQRAWRFPRLGFRVAVGVFPRNVGVVGVGRVVGDASDASHRYFFETTRVWIFTIVNSVMAIMLPRSLHTEPIGASAPPLPSIWTDVILAVCGLHHV